MDKQAIKSYLHDLSRLSRQLTWEWMACICLVVTVLCFYLFAVIPLDRALDETRQHAAIMQQNFKQIQRSKLESLKQTPSGQLDLFNAYFPNENTSTDTLEKLIEIAVKSGLTATEAQYKLVTSNPGKLLTYQISLPIKGKYPDVLQFVFSSLNQVHNLSLDNVQMQRQKVGDGVLDATLIFTLYLRREQ